MLDFERLDFVLVHDERSGERFSLTIILGSIDSYGGDTNSIGAVDAAIVPMFTQIGNHVHILPLKVAPILHPKAPNVATTFAKGILNIIVRVCIIYVSRGNAWIQEWATSTLCILQIV